MQRPDDTIGYAIKVGDQFEVRIVNVVGEQMRVGFVGNDEGFHNIKWVSERIRKELGQRN